jgi:hypothetical protein
MASLRKVVFAGKTEEGEKIVLYVDVPYSPNDFVLSRPTNRLPARDNYFIKRPDGETWAISPGSMMVTWEEHDETFGPIHCIRIESPEWSGVAKGTRRERFLEESMHI